MIVSFNIPDAVAPRFLDAMASRFGWRASDGPKGAFVRAKVILDFKEIVKGHEANLAASAAALAAGAAAEAEVDIS